MSLTFKLEHGIVKISKIVPWISGLSPDILQNYIGQGNL